MEKVTGRYVTWSLWTNFYLLNGTSELQDTHVSDKLTNLTLDRYEHTCGSFSIIQSWQSEVHIICCDSQKIGHSGNHHGVC